MSSSPKVSSARTMMLARLQRFSRVFFVALGIVLVGYAALYVLDPKPWILAGAAIIATGGGAVAWATRCVRLGKDVAAIVAMTGVALGGALVLVLVQPAAALMASVGPLLATAIVLSLGHHALLRPILAATVATGVAIGLVGAMVPPQLGQASDVELAILGAAYGLGLAVSVAVFARYGRDVDAALGPMTSMSTFRAGFLNLAAHDLRTPMTPAMIQMHLLRKELAAPPNGRLGRALDVLDRSLTRLQRRIEEITEVAQLQDDVGESPRHLNLAAVIRAAVPMAEQEGASAKARLAAVLDENLTIVGRSTALRAAFTALLVYAANEAGPDGLVQVRACQEPTCARVSVAAQDRGGRQVDVASIVSSSTLAGDGPIPGRDAAASLRLYVAQEVLRLHGAAPVSAMPGTRRSRTLHLLFPNPRAPPSPKVRIAGPGEEASDADPADLEDSLAEVSAT